MTKCHISELQKLNKVRLQSYEKMQKQRFSMYMYCAETKIFYVYVLLWSDVVLVQNLYIEALISSVAVYGDGASKNIIKVK